MREKYCNNCERVLENLERLRAENERLKEESRINYNSLYGEYGAVAEVKKLRAALERVLEIAKDGKRTFDANCFGGIIEELTKKDG